MRSLVFKFGTISKWFVYVQYFYFFIYKSLIYVYSGLYQIDIKRDRINWKKIPIFFLFFLEW